MDKNSSTYILIFILIMTLVFTSAIAAVRHITKPQADLNEQIFNKRAILAAVNDHLGMGEGVEADDLTDEQVLEIFDSKVEQRVLDTDGNLLEGVKAEDIEMAKEVKVVKAMNEAEESGQAFTADLPRLPLFIYEYEGNVYYIVSVRGKGLWDDIWGNIALESDLNTIAGASFDHKGETPGLGAEIKDNPSFARNFIGTKLFRDGEFVSVNVRKGGARDEVYEVDGISGATVTADGVSKMLESGLELYLPYLEQLKPEGTEVGELIQE